jgi:hypothetical protein
VVDFLSRIISALSRQPDTWKARSWRVPKPPFLVFKPCILRTSKLRFEFVFGSFFNALPVFSITYWLRSYISCIFPGLLQASARGSLPCPSAFRGASPRLSTSCTKTLTI